MAKEIYRNFRVLASLACFAFGACGVALGAQNNPGAPAPAPHRHHHAGGAAAQISPAPATGARAATAASAPAAAPVVYPSVLPSLLDQPAKPAKVDVNAGHLAIEADNSSLTAILHQIASDTGMTIDGLNRDQRIFGNYGPGEPHAVLSALLDGSGYNVVMLGQTAAGAPRQLTLSPRGAGVPSGPNRPMQQAAQEDDAEEDVQPVQNLEPPPGTPQPPPNGAPQSGGVKSPQQMLLEMQQMRQQQLQQQQQQQPPQ